MEINNGNQEGGTPPQANEHGITVFSRKPEQQPPADDTKTDPKQDPKEDPKGTPEAKTDPKETDDQKKKPEGQPKEDPKLDKSGKEGDQKPSFKVVSKTEPKPTSQEPKETDAIKDDNAVLKYLQQKGINVSSIAELTQKKELPGPVDEFNKFYEKTGRGIAAYYNSKRDWKNENSDDVIREYLRYTEPSLDDEGIESELNLLKVSEDEKDELSEREIKNVEQQYRKQHGKALKYLSDLAKEFNTPLKDEQPQQKAEPTPEERAAMYKPYWDKRDASLENLKEVSVEFDGLGELKFPLTQAHKDLIAKHTQTETDFFTLWQEQDGGINTDKSSFDMAWTIPDIRNEILGSFAEQIYTQIKTQESAKRRGVSIDEAKRLDNSGEGKARMHTIGQKSGNPEDNKFGTPLIPARS